MHWEIDVYAEVYGADCGTIIYFKAGNSWDWTWEESCNMPFWVHHTLQVRG
jgi:hypothetical protein